MGFVVDKKNMQLNNTFFILVLSFKNMIFFYTTSGAGGVIHIPADCRGWCKCVVHISLTISLTDAPKKPPITVHQQNVGKKKLADLNMYSIASWIGTHTIYSWSKTGFLIPVLICESFKNQIIIYWLISNYLKHVLYFDFSLRISQHKRQCWYLK